MLRDRLVEMTLRISIAVGCRESAPHSVMMEA